MRLEAWGLRLEEKGEGRPRPYERHGT